MPAPDPAPATALAIAIAGGSGSGKSTLARAVAAVLGDRCAVLEHDAYYRDQSHREPAARGVLNYDDPATLDNDLLAEHLALLRAGRSIDRPRYCFATHTRQPDRVSVPPRPVILVEGILVLSIPELRTVFDLGVFVDAPESVRYRRRLQRDVRERGRTADSVHRQWHDQVLPMHQRFVAPARGHADVVVSGTAPVEVAVRAVQRAVALHTAGRTDA